MRLAISRTEKAVILYDADSLSDAAPGPQIGPGGAPTPAWFHGDFWEARQAVVGQAPGRGASLFLEAGPEEWVLRPYRRGGLIARLSETRYLWTGEARSRAFRELRLTATLHERGLPVPRPVAACLWRHGLTYEAALITVRLPGAKALAERLTRADACLLARVGRTIRQFHRAGLDHVDLNARNLLVDETGQVWLIDLDRCRLRAPGPWRERNLQRLERSLKKFGVPEAIAAIRRGYDSASS